MYSATVQSFFSRWVGHKADKLECSICAFERKISLLKSSKTGKKPPPRATHHEQEQRCMFEQQSKAERNRINWWFTSNIGSFFWVPSWPNCLPISMQKLFSSEALVPFYSYKTIHFPSFADPEFSLKNKIN